MQLPLWVDTYAHTGYQGVIRGADGVFIGRTYVGTADAVAIVAAVNERAADKAEIARLRKVEAAAEDLCANALDMGLYYHVRAADMDALETAFGAGKEPTP